MRTQVLLHHPQEQALNSTLEIGVAAQEVVPLGGGGLRIGKITDSVDELTPQ